MVRDNYEAFSGLGDELKIEFYTSIKEAVEEIEHCFDTLNCRYDAEVLNELFRAVHSVKGNCHMVFLDGIADVCHQLEDIVSQYRKAEYDYTPTQGEFMSFIFARLEQLVADAVAGREPNDKDIEVLEKGVEQVFKAGNDQRDEIILRTLESFSGLLSSAESVSDEVLVRLDNQQILHDFSELGFMEQIAEIMASKSVQHKGDRRKLMSVGLKLNQQSAMPVDEDQFKAAFNFQSIGTKFVASPVFDLTADSPGWEVNKAIEQTDISAGFLKIGGKWLEASEMISHSYERYDGRGAKGIEGDQLHQGGMILSLLRFYQQNYSRLKRDNSQKIAVAKSISRIHSEKGYRFPPELVDCMAELARTELNDLML